MDKNQEKTLHYFTYCDGHNIEETYNDYELNERCPVCGDTRKTHEFSFKNKDEFAEKYTLMNTLIHYQNDEETLSEAELVEKIGKEHYQDVIETAREIYDNLIQFL